MRNDIVLRVVGKLLIPFILLFALYVQFRGDFGAGGGAQAGVIAAAAVVSTPDLRLPTPGARSRKRWSNR